MPKKVKSVVVSGITPAELKELSFAELQHQLEIYKNREKGMTQQNHMQALSDELQAYQIELEMQNRELRESQRQMEIARDRYADLYDFAPVCYIYLDSVGCIREINLTGATLLGQVRERLLGKPLHLWLKQGDNGRVFFNHLKQARESGKVATIELRLLPSKGRPLDVRLETILSQEEIDGKPSFHCVVIDVSERKQAEQEIMHQAQQLRLITDAIPAFIAYIDHQQRYQFANKAYQAWFRLPRDTIIGKTVMEVIGEQAYARVEEYIHLALAGVPVNFDVSTHNPDGSALEVSASYIPDIGSDGNVLGYFVVNRDVTEMRERESQDKMHMIEMARVARINTMGEMVAELAHELNQPLAAINIYSDAVSRMLRKGTTDGPEMQEALSEIRFQAERAGEVIRRLREFVSKRELHSEQIQFDILVKEVMNLIGVEARWHDTVVILELGQEPTLVEVDRILIEQVILNLARNAIEAMDVIDPSKRRLLIKTGMANNKEIEFSVEDSGLGIAADELEKIFEPFHTTKTHGMGMGLAISRTIIKAHQGRLWAIPNEAGGMTFTFILPCHRDH